MPSCRLALVILTVVGKMTVHAAVEPSLLSPPGPPLPATVPLTVEGDIASNLVAGVNRFLDRGLSESVNERTVGRSDDGSGRPSAAWQDSERNQLARMLGAVEARPPAAGFEWIASTIAPSTVATSSLVRVDAVRWAAFGEVHGEGLLLQPVRGEPLADVVAVPDADVTPEQLVGIEPGVSVESQYARRLAESRCRVVVPFLINRHKGDWKVAWDPNRGRNLSNREYLHRAAFEMGRTLAGYEVLKILAAVDDLAIDHGDRPIGVVGWGEGGRLALYAAALDPRIRASGVSGYFGPREALWKEPLDHNVFGLLRHLGDAQLAALVYPRALVLEAARGPAIQFPSDGGAPSDWGSVPLADVRAEFLRARAATAEGASDTSLRLVESNEDRAGNSEPGTGPCGSSTWLSELLEALEIQGEAVPVATSWNRTGRETGAPARAEAQRREMDRHTQQLLVDSPYTRQAFLGDLDTSSPEKFEATQARYREVFRRDVIGQFADAPLPFHPRSRLAYDAPTWSGYEVVLDVFPDVIAYGLLLVPKDLRDGERRPVVVCQHGLEGRPQHTIGQEGSGAYSAFSARLAEQGFITFAPQNLYLFHDRFRVLQRKANPLGCTLFSVIVPQHQQIVDWLKTLPFVDGRRIAFYGLSYGGKTAMRVPALVTDYCLSICSGDFNEWVWKNASTRSPYSYVWSGEYEIFEWNLGGSFNYAEMAALIAPRPFMVERGHFDGVAPDETVAYEFAKVRNLYEARLHRPPGDCQIEWFVGPHQVHGVGTFEFLHRHLGWPVR